MWEHKATELHPHIWSHGSQTGAAGGWQHFSSCQPRKFVLRERVAFHLALLLCARQVVRSKMEGTGREGEQRRLLKILVAIQLSMTNTLTPLLGNECWKAPDILDSTSELMQWEQNTMEMTVFGLFILSSMPVWIIVDNIFRVFLVQFITFS